MGNIQVIAQATLQKNERSSKLSRMERYKKNEGSSKLSRMEYYTLFKKTNLSCRTLSVIKLYEKSSKLSRREHGMLQME